MKCWIAIAVAALLAGCCCWRKSPYDHTENWIMREDAVRPFAVGADIIYLPGSLYTNVAEVSEMVAYARSEVGRGKFNGLARVFSPLVANHEDLEKALDWYFCRNDNNRPFVFIGEGAGGELLKAYEESNSEDLKEAGLIASFYTENSYDGFVKEWMVSAIRDAITMRRYREHWGREMPKGALGK